MVEGSNALARGSVKHALEGDSEQLALALAPQFGVWVWGCWPVRPCCDSNRPFRSSGFTTSQTDCLTAVA